MTPNRLNIILGILLLVSLVYGVHQTFTVKRLQTVAQYKHSRGILNRSDAEGPARVEVHAAGRPTTKGRQDDNDSVETVAPGTANGEAGTTSTQRGGSQSAKRTAEKRAGASRSPSSLSVSITQDGKIQVASTGVPTVKKDGRRAGESSPSETEGQDADREDRNVPDPAKSRVLLSQAQDMIREGYYDQAEGLLNESLDNDISNRMAWQQMAVLQHKQGLTEAEINTYMDWMAASPTDTTPYYQLAATYARMGQDQEARYYLEEYEAISGDQAHTYSQAAAVYRQLQDRGEEGRVLQQWLSETPNSVDARQAWADYNRRQGDYNSALNQYQDLTRVMPNNPRLYQQMGDLYRRMGDYGQAQRQYESALGLRPTDTGVLSRLGDLYYQNGDTAGAVGAYQEIIALEPGSGAARRAETRIVSIEQQLQQLEAYRGN